MPRKFLWWKFFGRNLYKGVTAQRHTHINMRYTTTNCWGVFRTLWNSYDGAFVKTFNGWKLHHICLAGSQIGPWIGAWNTYLSLGSAAETKVSWRSSHTSCNDQRDTYAVFTSNFWEMLSTVSWFSKIWLISWKKEITRFLRKIFLKTHHVSIENIFVKEDYWLLRGPT